MNEKTPYDGLWTCPLCNERFEPTTNAIYWHTYHEVVLHRCTKCKSIIRGAEVSVHSHRGSLVEFEVLRLKNVPKAIREKKAWLWEGVRHLTGDIVIDVQAPKLIPEGQHTGVIKNVEISEQKKDVIYIDVHVTCDGSDAILRAGYPQSSTAKTLLGDLLTRFGAKMEVGQKISLNKILKVGTKVSYQTLDKTTERGTFSRIIRDSLKPR